MTAALAITAVLPVHDEAGYLRTTLAHLVRNGIRLAILDNGSRDETPAILDEFSKHIDVRESMPWRGEYDLAGILARTGAIASKIRTGWIIHQDADEILESCNPHETLRQAIERVDRTRANAINFDEFVFFPPDGESMAGRDFRDLARRYYFHEPAPLRLMRAWRADSGLVQTDAGHRLSESGRVLHIESLDLRHYPFLSLEHARMKYSRRQFAAGDVERGWHLHRRDVAPEDMDFPAAERLKLWQPGSALDRSQPWTRHYWVDRKSARIEGGAP